MPYPVKGSTRLDNTYPTDAIMRAPFHANPYCNTSVPVDGQGSTATYQTGAMVAPRPQLRCLR